MYTKNFDEWFPKKKHIDLTISEIEREDAIRVGEIRWASFGVNIGSEIDGKGDNFLRPCLIIGIFSTRLVLAVPLSTKLKNIKGYVKFLFQEKDLSACVMQVKTLSQKRIFERIGKLGSDKVDMIKKEFIQFYNLN